MPGSYIVAGARTPIGKMSGALADFSAADLGGFAIAEALKRANVQPHEVEHVIVGQVLMAGQGQVPARQAAVKAGIPMNIPSVNINKVCFSSSSRDKTCFMVDSWLDKHCPTVIFQQTIPITTTPKLLANTGTIHTHRIGLTQSSMA